MIRYQCSSYLLPTIEAALAANGYHVEVPLQKQSNSAGAMVMTCGLASVLLAQWPDNATLEIEIWGVAQPIVANLLESLPIPLDRQPSPSLAVPKGA